MSVLRAALWEKKRSGGQKRRGDFRAAETHGAMCLTEQGDIPK